MDHAADRTDVYIGFDSAWTDNPKAPGAICAVAIGVDGHVSWYAPQLVTFDGALAFIHTLRSRSGVTLVALDQPTIVPNRTGNRPVERLVASLVSWIGGAVQPSNRGRIGMFCDAAPLWRFLASLQATEAPEAARAAKTGLYLIEVFPAAALPSIACDSFGRLKSLKYNPGRKTFALHDWKQVTSACAIEAGRFGCLDLASWCRAAAEIVRPRKADQDKLDATICLLVALRWHLGPRQESALVGDLKTGYMALPVSSEVRAYLTHAARKFGVPLDGVIPT